MKDAVRRIKSGKASGPDGIHGKVWALAFKELGGYIYTIIKVPQRRSLPHGVEEGQPGPHPEGGGQTGGPAPAYRPICLLDEAGKILERIIANRLVRHLSRTGSDLSRDQYGFRNGWSTVDAILRVRSVVGAEVEDGGVLMAVSLDITNAFNTLLWRWIRGALEHHGVPQYLAATVRDYLRDRVLAFTDRDRTVRERRVECEVPQGSVLGPLLWNLAYDHVLRSALPPGSSIVCYADDTLVLAGGQTCREATIRANIALESVVRSIRTLGLEVAARKTEAVIFRGATTVPPPPTFIQVGEARVQTGENIKYLGLQLDATWSFGEHFRCLAPKVEGVAMALGRLLPNLGGPGGRVRRVYATVVASSPLRGPCVGRRCCGHPPSERSTL